MVEQDEEKIIEVKLQPNTPRTQTENLRVPFGEVWRIREVVSLDRASPDFELALHVNGVRRGAVYALTVYFENSSNPMLHAFDNDNCSIEHLDSAYFVATPIHRVTQPISVKFRLTITRSIS